MKIRPIAFYLPQFYPTTENDNWWGKGFTEWTNVGRAKPLFKGHYQPKVPSELGYYDLRVKDTIIKQTELAKDYNIEGFCYWHYWFNGIRLLDRIFAEIVESKSPDFPFCLCWANHSWYAKTWDPTGKRGKDKLLIEQTYAGEQDYINHFNALLDAFKDSRYIRTKDNKLVFGVYAPEDIPEVTLFINTWNRLAKENGLNGFYFLGFTMQPEKKDDIAKLGFNGTILDYVFCGINYNIFEKIINKVKVSVFSLPKKIIDYRDYSRNLLNRYIATKDDYPCILPNFDHSPRSAGRGIIMKNATPKNWGILLRGIINKIREKDDENFLFIKAWNEWGEGNYLEPDIKYGRGFLEEIKKHIN